MRKGIAKGEVLSIKLRDDLFTLAQMPLSPYLMFFDISSKDGAWHGIDLDEVAPLFCVAVATARLRPLIAGKPDPTLVKPRLKPMPKLFIKPKLNFAGGYAFRGGNLIMIDDGGETTERPIVKRDLSVELDAGIIREHELTNLWVEPLTLRRRLLRYFDTGVNWDSHKEQVFPGVEAKLGISLPPTASFVMYFHVHRNPGPKSITEVAEYDGGEDLALVCTQLEGKVSRATQKRIVSDWCDFFSRPTPVRRLWFHSRLPPDLFDAVCAQDELRALYVKWSGVKGLSEIAGLRKMTHLYFGSSGGVEDLSPLAKLTALSDLSIDNFQKVRDYAPIAELRQLEHLMISAKRKIELASLMPFARLVNLKSFVLEAATIADGSFAPLARLKSLEHLDLPYPFSAAEAAALVAHLPNLRSGNVLDVAT